MGTVLVTHSLPMSSNNSNHLPCHSLRLMVFQLKLHHSVNSQQHQEQQPSTSSQLVLDSFTFATTSFGDNQLSQQKQQLSVCHHLAYAYPNVPTGIMSANPYECQQPATSFPGWFPQQQSYGELSLVANKEAPSTRFSPSPKTGFPSPPDGVFYCYLLEFCSPQVSKFYGCNQGLKPEGRVAQPPFNLVTVTKVNRAYYSNGEKIVSCLTSTFTVGYSV